MSDLGNKTLRQAMTEVDVQIVNTPLTNDGVLLLTSITIQPELMQEGYEEFKNEFLAKVLIKRVEVLGLTDRISLPDMVAGLFMLGINTPGSAIVYLIELLDYELTHNKVADIKAIASEIYPSGFYNLESMVEIIDRVIKPQLSYYSTIY